MKQAPAITAEDLVRYGSFKNVDELPENYEKLIQFASDLVMYAVGGNYNPLWESHVSSVTKAICCQVSYWAETGNSPLGSSEPTSYSLGELSVSVGASTPTQNNGVEKLCSAAIIHLKSGYLLYRGLRHGRTKTSLPPY